MAFAKPGLLGPTKPPLNFSLLPNHMATDTFEHLLHVPSSPSHNAQINNMQPLSLGLPVPVIEATYGMLSFACALLRSFPL